MSEGKAPEKSRISVYAVSALENIDPSEMGGQIMDGWDLVSFGPDGIELSLKFPQPLEVSVGEEPDLLLV